MSKIEFSRDVIDQMVAKLKLYFREELDQDIGGFDAEFLLDFFGEELGAFYYNKGLEDARNIIDSKVTEIEDAIYEIEKVVSYR